MKKQMSMRTKAFLIVMLCVLLPVIVGTTLSFLSYRKIFLAEFSSKALIITENFSRSVAEEVLLEDEGGIKKALSVLMRNKDIVFGATYDAQGNPLTFRSSVDVRVGQLKCKRQSSRQVRTAAGERILEVISPVLGSDRSVVGSTKVLFSLKRVNAQILGITHTILFISLIILILVSMLGRFWANTFLTKPIMKLVELVQNIAQGHYEQRISTQVGLEIDALAESVNLMSEQITRNIEEIKSSNEKLRITLHSIGDGVIATDVEGKIVLMNPVAEALTGWSIEEAKGMPLSEVFHLINADSREVVDNPVDKVLVSGQIEGLAPNTLLVAKDGTEHYIADSGAPIRPEDDSDSILGVVLVFRNVTEEHMLQEQLRQSQKMRAIGQLAGGIAHDFNNMLSGIIGAADLMDDMIPEDSEARMYYEMIMEAALRATDLNKNLLSFARKRPLATSSIEVHDSLYETVALLKNTTDRRIRINLDLAASDSAVKGDSARLHNAFLNLGINASQAMPDGGILDIESRIVEVSAEECETSPFEIKAGPYIEIEFRDTGCGIEPQHLLQIFEPFFTTKEKGKGTGLGLASVYGTVQQHEGSITVETEVGVGTSFLIRLPLLNKEYAEKIKVADPEESSHPPSKEKAKRTGRILIVDDELIIRDTVKVILGGLGYEILLAEDGEEGVTLFAKEKESIDLVLLDMIMPEMNGKDCFDAMRKMKPDLKVILSSGFSNEKDVEGMMKDGLHDFLQKPFRSSALIDAVTSALEH